MCDMFRGGFIIHHLSRQLSYLYIAATLDGLASCRIYSLKAHHPSTGHGW